MGMTRALARAAGEGESSTRLTGGDSSKNTVSLLDYDFTRESRQIFSDIRCWMATPFFMTNRGFVTIRKIEWEKSRPDS